MCGARLRTTTYSPPPLLPLLFILAILASCDQPINSPKPEIQKSNANQITSFKINGVTGTIDQNDKTIALTLPHGTDRSSLAPVIAVSPKASVSPASGVAQNFNAPVSYTVTAEDGSAAGYTATVSLTEPEVPSGEKQILTFTISGAASCNINQSDMTITILMPYGSSLAALVPVITVSPKASVSPPSGEARDFSAPLTYTVTAEDGATADYTVSAGVATAPSITLNLGGPSGVLTEDGDSAAIVISNYTDPEYLAVYSFTVRNANYQAVSLSGKNVTVDIQKGSSAAETVSLVYVHFLRQALLNAGAASVHIDTTGLAPRFNSGDWSEIRDWNGNYSNSPNYEKKGLFQFYPQNAGTPIMEGISVSTVDSKYVLVYEREVKVEHLVWGEEYDGVNNMPYYRFGVKKGSGGGSLSPFSGDWGESGILSSHSSAFGNGGKPVFAAYEAALLDMGLHHSQGVLANQSKVELSLPPAGEDTNIMSNGVYDFILAYYNPAPDYDSAAHETRDQWNQLIYTDGRALLPRWPNGLTLDGLALPDGLTARAIGGTTVNSMSRKGEKRTSGTPADYAAQTGPPREDFINNITVPMANYMRKIGVLTIANTNIIGDACGFVNLNSDFVPTVPMDMEDPNVLNAQIDLPSGMFNIGFIGNYAVKWFVTHDVANSEIDIVGKLPQYILATPKKNSVHVWGDISSEVGIHNIRVLHVHGNGGDKVKQYNTMSGFEHEDLELAIFYQNYTIAPTGTRQPFHRAFVDATTGDIKLTGPGSGFANKYLGSNAARPVPNFNGEGDLAANYAALASQYKWDAFDFGLGFTVTAETANSITLAWAALSGVSGYNIYRSPTQDGAFTKLNTALVTAATYTDTPLTAQTAYWYQVRPVNASGTEGGRAAGDTPIPALTAAMTAPLNVQAAPASPTSIALSWDAVPGAAYYNVFRATSAGGSYSNYSGYTTTETSFVSNNLYANTTYYYKISAVSVGGLEGPQSTPVSATTPAFILTAPANPTAATGYGSYVGIDLSWDAVDGATGYAVYRSANPTGPWVLDYQYALINGYPYSTYNTAYTDIDIDFAATFYYQMSAVSSSGEGPRSATVSAATRTGPAPLSLAVNVQNASTAVITWAASAAFIASGYKLYRAPAASGPFTLITTTAGMSFPYAFSYTDSALSGGGPFYYQLCAVNSAGTEGERATSRQIYTASQGISTINLTTPGDIAGGIQFVLQEDGSYKTTVSGKTQLNFTTAAANAVLVLKLSGTGLGQRTYSGALDQGGDFSTSDSNITGIVYSSGTSTAIIPIASPGSHFIRIGFEASGEEGSSGQFKVLGGE